MYKLENGILNVFFQTEALEVLLNVYNRKQSYCRQIAKETDISAPSTSKILLRLEKHKLVKRVNNNKSKSVELTSLGNNIAEILLKINNILKEV